MRLNATPLLDNDAALDLDKWPNKTALTDNTAV